MPPPEDGVTFHSLPDTGPTAYFWRVWRRLPEIHRAARAVRADVYHIPDPALVPLGLMLRRRGVRVVYDAHEDRPRQARTKYFARPLVGRLSAWVWAYLEAVARRRFDAFIAATPAIGRRYPPDRTIVVSNFPLLEEFSPERLARARPYRERPHLLAYVGGIQVYLGLREIITALDLVPSRFDVRLLVMGDFSRAHPGFEEELQQLPGWARVEHPGYCPRETVVRRLLEARAGVAFLHPRPEYPEAVPTKLFEYMAAGLPVLASDFAPWRELIGGLGYGLTADPLDVDAIARAIVSVLEDPEGAEALGARGRAAVEATYNWELEREKLLGLFAGLAASPQPIGTCPGSDPTRASHARISG